MIKYGIRLFLYFSLILFFGVGASFSAQDISIQHSGLVLHGKLSVPNNKKLTDGIILVVHGTLAHNEMETIKNLTIVLNERGLSTLAINLSLGITDRRGMYDCKILHRHKHTDALDEIRGWLSWLKSKDVKSIILMGHSRGGNQVARFASKIGDKSLTHLILLAPSTWDAASAQTRFETLHKHPLKTALETAETLLKKDTGDAIMPGIGILFCPKADSTVASFVSYYSPDRRHDTPSILPEIIIPTLVIAGGRDTVVKNLISKVKATVDRQKLQLKIIDDADHFFLDLFAEDVADAIEEFLL